jgi:hypothetical protein
MSDPHAGHEHSGHGHEKSDAHPGSIAGFEVALLVLAIVSMAAMGGLFYYFTNREAVADTSRSPLAAEGALPPAPNLQVSPASDLEQLHADENMRLNTYGWVDKEQGVIRIPIEKAMEIVAKQGLPVRLPPATGQ